MINYTNLVLFTFGMLGILLHNLVELNKLNKASNCTFKIKEYFKLEIFSILISIIVVIVCLFASTELKQIQILGKWLGLGFMAIGYMGQSLLIFFMGKVNKIVNNENSKNSTAGDVTGVNY